MRHLESYLCIGLRWQKREYEIIVLKLLNRCVSAETDMMFGSGCFDRYSEFFATRRDQVDNWIIATNQRDSIAA